MGYRIGEIKTRESTVKASFIYFCLRSIALVPFKIIFMHDESGERRYFCMLKTMDKNHFHVQLVDDILWVLSVDFDLHHNMQ